MNTFYWALPGIWRGKSGPKATYTASSFAELTDILHSAPMSIHWFNYNNVKFMDFLTIKWVFKRKNIFFLV